MYVIESLCVFSFQSVQPPQFLARRTLPPSKVQPYPPSRLLHQFRQERLHWPPLPHLPQPAHRASCPTKRKLTCPPSPPLRSRWKHRGEPLNWSCSNPHRSSACRGCSSRYRYDWKDHWSLVSGALNLLKQARVFAWYNRTKCSIWLIEALKKVCLFMLTTL